ncbi:MAG: DUF4357 domain-containing protein [Synergistaceae bacterium]|nr:DUF4357 domain-containing protein [Synergistaceae bacterium]
MDKAEKEVFYCKRECSGALAEGRITFIDDKLGFTVFKGSVVSSYVCDHMQRDERVQAYYECRLKLQETGVIEKGVFQTDYTFSSPSSAATVVLGCSANGNTEWRTENGKLLGDIRPDH